MRSCQHDRATRPRKKKENTCGEPVPRGGRRGELDTERRDLVRSHSRGLSTAQFRHGHRHFRRNLATSRCPDFRPTRRGACSRSLPAFQLSRCRPRSSWRRIFRAGRSSMRSPAPAIRHRATRCTSPRTILDAIDWLELQTMKSGRKTRDEALIDQPVDARGRPSRREPPPGDSWPAPRLVVTQRTPSQCGGRLAGASPGAAHAAVDHDGRGRPGAGWRVPEVASTVPSTWVGPRRTVTSAGRSVSPRRASRSLRPSMHRGPTATRCMSR